MQNNIEPEIIRKRFWDMFAVDAFIGNFDRHNGNWGFLYNSDTDDFKLTPVYDCGSCLYPQADEDLINKILIDNLEKQKRIFIFPNSAIKINNKKINYSEFLLNTRNQDCLNSVIGIFQKINLKEINNMIDDAELLTNLQKQFYKTMLAERYEKIMMPAFKYAKDILKKDTPLSSIIINESNLCIIENNKQFFNKISQITKKIKLENPNISEDDLKNQIIKELKIQNSLNRD